MRFCLWLVFAAGTISNIAAQQSAAPVVGFEFSFPGSQPDRYSFSVQQSGEASYSSDWQPATDSSADNDFQFNFVVSPETRSRIFALAQKAGYFKGDLDSKKKGLAMTGIKTLSYRDAEHNTKASYNYSTIPAIQELTQTFQGMSTTMEFGRRLDYDHRYQKLALDEELKRMDDMLKRNSLQEVAAIAPLLKLISEDSSLINPVRARAQRILAQVQNTGQ